MRNWIERNATLSIFVRTACAGILLVTLLSTSARPADVFPLSGGGTVVFFGDSITQAGNYVDYVEAYLLTRYPDKQFRVLDRGISGETISGTSEPGHDPPRGYAHDRFARDVASVKPDFLFACFGMNDGNYLPFNLEVFEKYQNGVMSLIDRAMTESGSQLVLLTPPPFDPYRRRASDPEAKTFGYKYPAVDYDVTLGRFSSWMSSLKWRGVLVADVHLAINDHLHKRRQEQVSYYLAPDAVHPNKTGHWLMAQTLLLSLEAPAVAAEAQVDARSGKSLAGVVEKISRSGGGLNFVWRSPLPMPHDPEWDAKSIEVEQVAERLNRYRLAVSNLAAGRYRLSADDKAIGEFTHEQLAAGVDLSQQAAFPTVDAAQRLLKSVSERRDLTYRAWRDEVGRSLGDARSDADKRTATVRVEQLGAEIEQLRQPRDMRIKVEPIAN